MELLLLLVVAFAGLAVGAAVTGWLVRSVQAARFDERTRSHDIELGGLRDELARERTARTAEQAQATAERTRLEQQVRAGADQLAALHAQLGDARAAQAKSEALRESLELAGHELRGRLETAERLEDRVLELERLLAEATTREQERARELGTRETLLTQAREVLTEQFKAVSSELLEQKAKQLDDRHADHLVALLKPFREQIDAFQREVRDATRIDLEGRTELKGELKQLRDLNQSLSSEAHALAQALRGDVKKRGNWGELVLERLLELAGLQPGREFDIQPAVVGHDQQRQFPDVVLRLTDERSVVIDSKLSLSAYERLAASDDDEEREKERKAHRQAMRTHIESLASKRYSESPDLKSPEFVVMFVPIEAAYLEAISGDDSLYELAISKRIIVASPGMLLGLLRIVHELWRVQERQKNAEEIARVAGTLYDAFVRTAENLNIVAQRMGGAQDELAEAIKRIQGGRGNILGQIERLRALGAKASKALPAAWANQIETPDNPALPGPAEDGTLPEAP